MLRRFLDRLYVTAAVIAALALAAICVLMLAQAAGREVGILIRGADDIVAWLTAACAFLALAHTFRHGDLVRVGVFLDRLGAPWRWRAEVAALGVTTLFTIYMLWAVAGFVYESWRMNELAQGLLIIPIWIPQTSLVLGIAVFLVAVLDEFAAVLRRRKPSYQVMEEARAAAADFSERL
ncbi:MAG TPA: TRAP transporter small permease [Burkholderiales bacterium]|nr:TRAP transporter small permease [Burkholderiales bacterium]